MKATELREMTDVELNKQLKDLKAELFNLRFQHAINQLDNPIRIESAACGWPDAGPRERSPR